MTNTTLKAVLTELINCMNDRNKYTLQGWLRSNENMKICMFGSCLDKAGYKMITTDNQGEIYEGVSRCCVPDYYAAISFDVPGAPTEDIKAFQEAGFEWLWTSNVMKYEFDENGKGR